MFAVFLHFEWAPGRLEPGEDGENAGQFVIQNVGRPADPPARRLMVSDPSNLPLHSSTREKFAQGRIRIHGMRTVQR